MNTQQIHIIPVGGSEPLHHANKSCWCLPLQESNRSFIHHAKDCREKWERQGINDSDKKWVLVYSDDPLLKGIGEARQKALDLCHQIEKCGASEELTKASVMASELTAFLNELLP